ncbi:MAG: ABC transporter substrate-binding protein [Gemmatimonadota bacterium]
MRSIAPRLALVHLLVLSACSGGSGSGGTTQGSSVTIIEIADISKPHPLISETSLDNGVSAILYRPILGPRWENGELQYLTAEDDVTALARSYEYFGPDSASIRYHLRSDARWSDGRPVTAHDAVWTMETRGDPRTASPRQEYNRQIREIVAEDDSTLVVHFTRRYPEMLFHTGGAVAPRHLYEDTDPAQLRSHPAVNNPGGGNLVVSGPYMIGEWLRGQRLVLVPNPEFQPQPNIQRVVFLPIPEETTRMIELQTGNADMMQLPFDKLELIRTQSPEIRFEVERGRFYDYIAYNPNAHPFLADPEIRRALGLAIDRPALIAALQIQDYAAPAGGPYAPIFRLLYDPVAHAALPYDTLQAKQILDAKGWIPGPDGTRVRSGTRFAFTLATNAGNQRRADASQIIQQAWRRIGVDVQLQTLESNTFFDRLNQRNFEAALAGWGVGLAADMSDMWQGDNPFNQTAFENAEVNRLFDTALSQPTEELAAPYWREAATLIVAEQPYSWLYYMDQVWGVNDRIRNTRIDTLGSYQNIHEWTIVGEEGGAAEGGSPS